MMILTFHLIRIILPIMYYPLNFSKIIVILLSRNKKRAKKRRKFNVSWLLFTTQTPYIFNINVKHVRIFIIFDYRFYLFFMLYFYFHRQQVSYGYHDCITTTKSVESFPSLTGSSDNLFFRYFYIILQRNSLSIHQ